MKLRFFRSFLAVFAAAGPVLMPASAAETGVVNEGTVNVRGRAGFIGEIVTKVNRGDVVTIIEEVNLPDPKPGEPAAWLKIALPANTPVWVHTSYIDPATQTITASRLKVRGGPSIHHSVLGYLSQGTPVRAIRTQGDWTEIEPTSELYAFIAADMVTRSVVASTATEAPAVVTAPAETPQTETPTTTIPTETSPAVTGTQPAETEVSPAPETVVVTEPAPPTTITLPPDSTTIVAEPAPAIATAPVQSDRDLPVDERARQVLEQRTRDGQRWDVSAEPTDALLKELPANRRVVIREGEIRRALSIQAPSDHILQHIETGLRLNYLYTPSTNIPIADLLGVRVRIRGEEGIDPRWPGTPVLLIKSLEVLP